MATIKWNDNLGREMQQEVSTSIPDVHLFRGLAGHAWMLIAANPHLSGRQLKLLLEAEGIERTKSWIYRRLWMFRRAGAKYQIPLSTEDKKAISIMQQHPKLSARKLSEELAGHGIKRAKDWVRQHRCDNLG